MYPKRETVSVTTSAGGAATAYTSSAVRGRIVSIAYVKDTFDNGVGFTITGESSATNIWTESAVNASKTVSPRLATHDTSGAALLYAAGGSAVVAEGVFLAGERVKIVVASGGATKAGSFVVTWI